jgi:hypothetical protein
MYRPTVRYDEAFRGYVDALFHTTHLDRNQILRAALFAAAHSKEFQTLLRPYQKGDVPPPSPSWSLEQDAFWLEQCPKTKGEGGDVNVEFAGTGEIKKDNGITHRSAPGSEKQHRRVEPIARSGRAISPEPIKITGKGLVFTLD